MNKISVTIARPTDFLKISQSISLKKNGNKFFNEYKFKNVSGFNYEIFNSIILSYSKYTENSPYIKFNICDYCNLMSAITSVSNWFDSEKVFKISNNELVVNKNAVRLLGLSDLSVIAFKAFSKLNENTNKNEKTISIIIKNYGTFIILKENEFINLKSCLQLSLINMASNATNMLNSYFLYKIYKKIVEDKK